MRKLTQKQIIVKHVQDHGDWLPSYKLSSAETRYGFIGSQGSRRCRELAEEGKLERKIVGKYVYYKVSDTVPKPERYVYDEERRVMVRV